MVLAVLFTIHNALFTIPASAQVGTWKNYLAYQDVQQIQAAGDHIFVLASNGLYQYNQQDQSIYTYDKTNGLTDSKIASIKWCSQAKRLVAIYSNTNIDLIDVNGNIINVSDIYMKAITGDKTINSVTIDGQYAYLACGFGVVKLDVKKAEISESYMFGRNVTHVAVSNGYIYARITETYQYSDPSDFVIPYQGSIPISPSWNDNKTHTLVYVVKGSLSDNLIDVHQWTVTTEFSTFTEDNSDYDKYIETVKTLSPGGPKYNYFGFMKFVNGKLFTCNGNYTNEGTIQVLDNNEWRVYSTEGITTNKNHYRLTCLDVDPLSADEHVFAGGRSGLYEFRNGAFVKYYDYTNSPIERFDGTNQYYQIVTGTQFDKSGNLWFLNSNAPTASLIKMSTSGQFTKYNHSEYMKYNANGFTNKSNDGLSHMMFDSRGLLWFSNDTWRLPAAYQYNTTDNTVRSYELFVNEDGSTLTMPSGIKCIVEDMENNLWFATPVGPLMLEKDKLDEDNPTFTQVKVPRNDGTNYADYLLAGIKTTCIAVDAGGRKWFGTSGNGVFLITADNMEQIHHFTSSNSYLLSDNILSIAINDKTGEVFFGTESGLCSYMGDATETYTEMTKDNVWAYPNPVTPGYTGLITVTGLTLNADVKILSESGALIAEGRSNGGTFTWDGCDKKGNRVASGIYMVATATKRGEKGTVCKIAIVN